MSRQIATFVLDQTVFGLDILLAKEVYKHTNISPVPEAPSQILGLMNLRGKVVTLIDLNICLNRTKTKDNEDSRLLILKTNSEILPYREEKHLADVDLGDDITGILIDRMDDVLSVEAEDILPPPPNLENIDEKLIDGVIKKNKHLVILLNVTAVINQVYDALTENDN